MDKYTVDLDKLLNDFEYNELTDNQDDVENSTGVSHQNGKLNNTIPTSSLNPKNSTAKHSITNVFHSLNEYLNTDISNKTKKFENTLINKVDDDYKTLNIIPVPNLMKESNTKEFINDLKPSQENNEIDNDELSVHNEISDEDLEEKGTVVREDVGQINEQCDIKNEIDTADCSAEDLVNTVHMNSFNVNLDDIVENKKDKDKQESKNEEEIITLSNVIAHEEVKPLSFDTVEIDDVELDKFLEEIENEYDQNHEQEIVNEIQQQDVVKELEEVVNKCEQETIETEKDLQDKLLEETNMDNVINATDISLDSSDNFNKETGISINEQEGEGATEETSVSYGSEEIQKETSISTNSDRPTSLELDCGDNKREIDLIGSPGSTPYNNMYLNKEESSGSDITSTTLTDSEDSACLESDDSENINKKIANQNESKLPEESKEKNNTPTTPPVANDAQTDANTWLGKQPPYWMPDAQAPICQQCSMNFTLIKRRHHCRACGLVLCSKCCNMKYLLPYLEAEARVCQKCYDILVQQNDNNQSDASTSATTSNNLQPKPNNPMEYCSVVPPHQQVINSSPNPPTVMVPVGVLKRKGSGKSKSNKSVMFCDGIRPGSDLTNLDADFNYTQTNLQQAQTNTSTRKHSTRNYPIIEHETKSFIPPLENSLPPTVNIYKSETTYSECTNNASIVEMLKSEIVTFALNKNLLVHIKIINMSCCINKTAWCFTTEGLIAVGQDEIVFLIECIENEKLVPKDIFYHINNIYCDAVKGNTVTELGLSVHNKSMFLESKNHAGFLYIRPTLQCLQNVIVPSEPYLIGLLIHRWESPWAKIFPLRLILRLGAEYRYYPSPLISTRDRDSVFVEIGHTVINVLADFKNFSYTLPSIRGLTIHMEDKNTTVTIPSNRYDQVMKTLNNSSDHILAFGGNFSMDADSHLVCIQDTQSSTENNYTTHAININNKPRKSIRFTGASFIVFNGALKSSSGLTAKSSIIEDGLMIQIPSEHMVQVRENLKNMKNHTIQCGCINAVSDELVKIVWGEPDNNFNTGIMSPIDKQPLSGVPSIRVHNGKDYACHSGSRIIRWTEVFILQNGDELTKGQQDPVDVSKVAESISKATCSALVKYLDLLASNNFYKIGIRTTLHMDNVSYSAGSNGIKLPPIYMKSLDNELVPVLHRITSNNLTDNAIILELIFRILSL